MSQHADSQSQFTMDAAFALFIIERIPIALAVYDAGGTALYSNPMARQVLGLDSEEFQSRTSTDWRWQTIHEDGTVFHPDDYPINQSLRTGEPRHDVVMGILRPDQTYSWVVVNSEPIVAAEEGLPRGVVAIFIDITEQVSLRKQLHESQKLDAIGKLSGGVAHDFRNILQAITTSCDLLARKGVDEGLQRQVETIRKATVRGADLTQQLLTVARQRVVQASPLDLGEVVQSSMQIFRPAIGAHIQVESRIAPDLWLIRADPGTMNQVLMNLILNARDAMPDGGLLVIDARNFVADETYARRHVDLQPGEYVLLTVTDTGCGIPPHIRDRIFEPYFSTKADGHSGLGLAVVYGIVKQQNGRIWIYSESDKGTVFKIFFPRHAGVERTTAPVPAAVEAGRGERIVLVDDDEFVRDVLAEALKMNGYRVTDCSTAAEAVEAIKNQQVDLLLTDVVMPGMSGRQLAETMPGVKVIYMSGYTDAGYAGHFIEKPVRTSELLRVVRAALDE